MLYCTTTYSDMVCILNQLINTKILLLVSIKSYERVQNKPQIIIKLNLSKLKQLCVRSCTSNIEQLLIGLPEGVLNELHIHDKSNFNIQTLTQMQKNIKKMICYSGVDDFMPWKNLKLIHLDIGKSVKNNHFDSILNITTLEELLLNTSKVSANVFARIYKLSNLKVLSLYNLMMTQIKELACIQSLKRLESLNLHGHRGQLMEEHLTQISENLTNLKEIRLDFEFLSNKIAHAFLKNCKQLKVMEMIAPATIQNFNDTICQQGLENLQLEELTIYYGLHNNQLVNMLTRKCPNLKKLVLFGTIVNDRCLWNLLLTLNLKSVYIENQSFLSIEAKMFLSKFGNDLMEII